MPAPVSDYTNGQLMDIIAEGETHFLFTQCVAEMNTRIDAVNVRTKKGFEHPNDPPANP